MFYIDQTRCAGCGKCMLNCQRGAIKIINQKAYINNKLCNECGMCYEICPNGAVVEVKLPEKNYQEAFENIQTQTNSNVSMGKKHIDIATAIANMFQAVYDLFARVQNQVSTRNVQYNQYGYRRGRGMGQRKRGRGRRPGCRRGRFF